MEGFKKLSLGTMKKQSDFVVEQMKKGKTFIRIHVNEDKNVITELIAYCIDSNKKTWLSGLINEGDSPSNRVVLERLEPYYSALDDENDEDVLISDVDIDNDSQNVIGIDSFKYDLDDMRKYFNGKSFSWSGETTRIHYEFYFSDDDSDIENMGGSYEIDFIEKWLEENGGIKA